MLEEERDGNTVPRKLTRCGRTTVAVRFRKDTATKNGNSWKENPMLLGIRFLIGIVLYFAFGIGFGKFLRHRDRHETILPKNEV